MKNIKSFINNIISEEFDRKSKEISNNFGLWYEIETKEELHKNQKKLDLAKPKGKLTAADFKALRDRKKFTKKKEKEVSEEVEYELEINDRFGPKTVSVSESDMVNLVYNIIKEEKDNIAKKEPTGLKKTQNVLRTSKKENDSYLKDTSRKMSEYSKMGSKGKYEENPKQFPKGNGELGKMNKKAYKASDAVTEYIENFAYPGLENVNYDEIKPNDTWVKDNIKGTSKTGNNPTWANAVETELGEKINKKREANLYGIEKKKGSYKRVTQPVDEAGEGDGEKSIDKMFMKLESKSQKNNVIAEEMSKMKNLIEYNRKTQ